MKNLFLIALIGLISIQAFSQERVTEFVSNPTSDKVSLPSDFVIFKNQIFFEAYNESDGQEIWVTDGEEDNARLLKDIYPGKKWGIWGQFSLSSAILNNTLYFIANDGLSNGEIWKTDGTTAGTQKVTHFINSQIERLTQVGDALFFLRKVADSLEVWKSDGSESGTVLVKGGLPIWDTPSFEDELNDLFIFTFQPFGFNESKVWRSDGTASGTFPLTDEVDGNGAGPGGTSALTQYIKYNNTLYFVVRSRALFGSNSVGIVKTDGSLINTVPIIGLYDGSQRLMSYVDAIEIKGKFYFSFYRAGNGHLFIWESDGFASGTQKVYDVVGSNLFFPSNLAQANGQLLFTGLNNGERTSLFTLDPSTQNVSEIKELSSNLQSSNSFNVSTCRILPICDEKFFIFVPGSNYRSAGWVSDLTPANTQVVEGLENVAWEFTYEGDMFFAKNNATDGRELWKYDCNANQVRSVDNLNKFKEGLYLPELSLLRGNLIFQANDGNSGLEPWTYNSLNDILSLIKDIRKDSLGSFPKTITNHNGQSYFIAYDDDYGYELWKSNGTVNGTVLLFDIIDGSQSSRPRFLTSHKSHLYFTANKGLSHGLFRTDGITLESISDYGVNNRGIAYRASELMVSNDQLFTATPQGVWVSDGTSSGSSLVKELSGSANLTDVNGRLFFTAAAAWREEIELWTSDGTSAGTKQVKNIGAGYSSSPKNLFAYDELLYFSAFTQENGRELWRSDGTDAGTFLVADLYAGAENGLVDPGFCILKDRLYFMANDGINGPELWTTADQASGPSMVLDINPGEIGSFPAEMTSIGDQMYFQAYDPEYGMELWRTDGTTDGTSLVKDILAGPQSSSPSQFISVANDMFFIAETEAYGQQVWKLGSTIVDSTDLFVAIYPNPTADVVFLQANRPIQSFQVVNLLGQQIQKQQALTSSYIDLTRLAPGVYLIVFDLGESQVVKKVVRK